MRKQLHAIVEFTSNNLSAYIVEVDGIVGVGKNIDEVKESLRQSIKFVLEDAKEDCYDVPDELNGEYEIIYTWYGGYSSPSLVTNGGKNDIETKKASQ